MPQENYTAKFRVDISDLKKGIADANKSIKLANAEFKNATAGLDNWTKSADGLTAKIKQQNAVVDAEKQKLDLLKQQLDRLNKSQQDGEKVIKDLTAKYNDAVKTYGATSEEAKKYAKQLADAEAAQERNTKAAEDLNLKILNQDTAVKNASAQVSKYETALEELTRETDNASDASDDLNKSVGNVDDAANKTTNGGLNAFGVAIGNLAANVVGKLIDKLGDLAGAVKDSFLEFDEGRDAVVKATGATGDAADELTKSYANVSKRVIGNFDDIGGALGEVNTRFGYTGKELEDTTERFIKFADITGTDATKAVQLVSRAMGDAGIDSSEYSKILDDLAIAAQASGIGVDKLTENLTKYGAPMRALGFDTKESIAIFAQWEKAGVNTEIAFSGMKKAIGNWSAEGKDAREEFKKTLDEIASAPDIASATTQAIEIFGQKAGPDLADAIQAGRFEYSDFLDLLEGSQGTVTKTYDETQSGADKAKLAIQNMKTTAAELANNFMQKYGPDIEKAIEGITGLLEKWAPKIEDGIEWISDHLPEIESLVIGIGVAFGAWKVAGIISAVTAALAGMSAAEVVAAAKTWLLNTALLANPIGLIIAAIAGLVAAFIVLWKKSDKFREFWINLWEKIKKAVKPVIDFVVENFKKAWDKIKTTWSVVSAFFKGLWDGIKKIFSAVTGYFKERFETAWNNIKTVWGAVTGFFKGVWDGIKKIFSTVVDWFRNTFKKVSDAIHTVVDPWIEIFRRVWTLIKEVFAGVVDWFKEKFQNAWLAIKTIWDVVVGFFKGIWEDIKAIFTPVIDWFKEKFENAWLVIQAIWSVVSNFFSGIWTDIKAVFSTVGDWFSEKFQNAVDRIKAVFGVVKSFFQGVWDGIKSVFSHVADWFKDVFSKAWQKVKDVFSTGGKIFDGIKDGIVNAFKTVVNAIIRGLNKIIKIPFEKINGILDTIQDVEILGVSPFDWLSARLPIPQIPELAKGGIVDGQTFIAGEAGEEAVIPLERNTQGLKKIADLISAQIKIKIPDELIRLLEMLANKNDDSDPKFDFGKLKQIIQDIAQEITIVVQPAPGSSNGGSSEVVNNYNFTQNNTSPKALSRYEIYRQTRNLINAAKGV